MFNFSTKTEVDKRFKLSELYKQMNATREVKQNALNISSITLKNVISPMTLNSKESTDMKEFYIIEIETKSKEIPELFINELDKIIKIQTVFIIKHDEYKLAYTCYKKAKIKKYYLTNWSKITYDLPLDLNVPSLYKFIISKMFVYQPFESESVLDYISRYNQLIKLDFQIQKTESAIQYENQSKKRFEYNERLKEYKKNKEELLKEVE